MSQLLTPGPRTLYLPALPVVFALGRAKAAGLNHWEKVPLLNEPLPTTLTRWPSPPPVRSTLSVVVKVTACGIPLTSWVTPESCQSSAMNRTTGLGRSLLAFGHCYV